MADNNNKKQTTSNKTTQKQGSGTQQKKKTQSRENEQIKFEDKNPISRQHLSIILAGVAAIFFFITVIPGESVWNWCHEALKGLFGFCAWVIPIILVYVVVVFSKDDSENSLIGGNLVGAGIISIFFTTAGHIFSSEAEYMTTTAISTQITDAYSEHSFSNGGAIGAVFGSIMGKYLGRTGAVIIILILLVTSVLLFTGITLPGLVSAFKKPIKKISEVSAENARKIEEMRERKRVEREENDEDEEETGINPDSGKISPPVIDNSGAKVPVIDTGRNSGDLSEPPMPETSPSSHNTGGAIGMPAGVDGTPGVAAISPAVPSANIDVAVADGINDNDKKKERKPRVSKLEKQAETESKKSDGYEHFDDGSITPEKKEYVFPSIECLEKPVSSSNIDATAEMQMGAKKLVSTLESFKIKVEVTGIVRGPSVTRYELLPEPGVRISKITTLADDIALRLAAQSVRIEAPIPGKSAIGIEIPNEAKSMVRMREIIDTETYRAGALKSKLNVALGKDITGNIITADLTKMPHLLVAGTTGSGKSVCMNAMIISILYNASPDDVRLLMIDPKQVEFIIYNGIAHLEVPVVTEAKKAAGALSWAVSEMEKRYKMFSENSVRDIKGYNKLAAAKDDMEKMHHIVIFIDELSDLMMAAPKEVEDSICRLAQMARAAGIHLVIATQSPRADIITGLIKANIPSRIALKVSSPMESRIIFDQSGAEKLLGNGDLLFNPVGTSKPTRVQGCFISDDEVEAVVNHIKKQSTANYNEETMHEIDVKAAATGGSNGQGDAGDDSYNLDPMFDQAVEAILLAQQASTTMLQKKLKLGYARASRVMDQLEEQGIVGPSNGAKPRDILITQQMWYERKALGAGPGTITASDGQIKFDDNPPVIEAPDEFFAPENYEDEEDLLDEDEEIEPIVPDPVAETEPVEVQLDDEFFNITDDEDESEDEDEDEDEYSDEILDDEPEMLDDAQFYDDFDDIEGPVNIDDVFADDDDYSGN